MIRKRKQTQLKRDKIRGCVQNNPIKLKNGETERKRVEEQLKQSKNRYEYLSELTSDYVYSCVRTKDTPYRIDWIGGAFEKITGYTTEELLQSGCWTFLVHPEDTSQLRQYLSKSEPGQSNSCEFRIITKDRSIRWIKDFSRCESYGDYPVYYRLYGASQDITERKNVEEALVLQAVRTQALLDLHMIANESQGQIMDFVLEATLKATQSRFSFIGLIDETESFMTIHAWSKDTMKQCSLGDKPIHFPISEAGVLGDCVRQRKPIIINDYEAPWPTKKGYPEGHVPIQRFLSIPVFDGGRIVAVTAVANKGKAYTEDDSNALIALVNKMWEILRRKLTEEELKQIKHKYELILQSAGEGILVLDLEGKQKFVNPIAAKMLGYEIEELIGQSSHTICHHSKIDGSPYPEKECSIYAAYTDGVIHTRDDEVFWRKDGTSFPIRYTSTPIWENDKLTGAVVIFIDITELKQAEKEIDRLASFPLTSPSPVLEVDSSGTVTFYNIAAIKTLKRLGVKENLRLFFPRDINAILKTLEQKKDEEFYREVIIGDATFEEYIQVVPQYNCIRIRSVDISEHKKLESQLLQSQKMEAVGQLSGGIAHDFNNILTAIIGYATVLQMKMSKEDPLRHNADQILASSERAANLTQSLLAFSRKQIMNLQPVKINEIVKRVEKLLLRIIGADIDIKTILTEEDLTIMADSGQIEQVLMNLATNTRDAMPDGGSLTIETEIVELDEKYIKTHGYGEQGMYARISFTDTGAGMDERTRERIFEPFFTTKEVGKGTGLGLSMVYAIIKQHNSYINVYSELGKGTTFKIYLPLIKTEIKETKLTEPAPSIGGTEMILLAEDDEDVRTFTKAVLDEFGYTVIEAVDGRDAIDKFMKNKDKIELVILDVIMPMKSGKGVYEEIKKIRADIKTIFMSGYTSDSLDQQGIIEKELDFILKPVSPTKLLRKIREVLEK